MKQGVYSKFIDPYIDLIKNNRVPHCKEQDLMIDNIVIPTLSRRDVFVDDEKIERGLKLQKYFGFELVPWELFLFALIAGTFFTSGDIVFKTIAILVGRGSGKNGFISFLAFYFLSEFHDIHGYNIYILANTEKQALTSFDDIRNAINKPLNDDWRTVLKKKFRATFEVVVGLDTQSELRYLTSSTHGKDSLRVGCVILDEEHEYTDDKNINTLTSGFGKRPHERKIIITTDGHIRDGVLDKAKAQYSDILSHYDPDNRTLVFWCRIEDEKEWNDMDALAKSMPSLPYFPHLRDAVREDIRNMPYNPDYYPEFLAKRCNYPVGNQDQEVASWENIMACCRPVNIAPREHCVVAIDYTKINDFCCAGIGFGGPELRFVQHTWVCRSSQDLIGIKAPLSDWEKSGDLTFVDGPEIPADLPANWASDMTRGYRVDAVCVDNFRYALLAEALIEVGFDAKAIKLIRPSDIMKIVPVVSSYFANQQITWGDTPIMRWYTNNAKKIHRTAGNYYYDKIDPQHRKTDGFMALVYTMIGLIGIPPRKKAKSVPGGLAT